MGINETYHLKEPVLCIHSEDGAGRRIPILLPVGAIVKFLNGPLDGIRLVDVEWEGKTVMMFTADLRDRATLISPT